MRARATHKCLGLCVRLLRAIRKITPTQARCFQSGICCRIGLAMRRLLIACLLQLMFLSSNVWLLELCGDSSGVSDCCPEGFCPHHQHVESAQSSSGDDCICKLSSRDHQSLWISLSAPAIMPAVSGGLTIQVLGLIDSRTSHVASFDHVTATPPPKV